MLNYVSGSFRRTPLGIDCGVIDDVKELRIINSGFFKKGGEILPWAGRENLVLCVMVMDAVGEEYPLCIHQEILPLRAVLDIAFKDGLKGVAYPEVVFAILVPEYVTAVFCGL